MASQNNMFSSFHVGLQKLTLLDFPGKMASTIFIPGCNFRCPFCHNSDLVLPDREFRDSLISADEALIFLHKRIGITEGVCITGGEPLMNIRTKDLISAIRELGLSVKLDTNGSFPDRLEEIVEENLVDYVAMDIKNSPQKYDMTIGVPGMLESVRRSVTILQSRSIEYEFRTTLVREFHEESDILAIAEWIAGAKHYALQNFVDSGHLLEENLHALPADIIKKWAEKLRLILPDVIVRGIA